MTTLITRILNPTDNALRLDLNPATGWRRVSTTMPGRVTRRFGTITSRYFDSEFVDGPATKAPIAHTEQLRVHGDLAAASQDEYDVSLTDRYEALVSATSSTFLWVVSRGGYLWTYRSIGPASDVDPTQTDASDLVIGETPVVLTFKVHPNPTKVPLGGGV